MFIVALCTITKVWKQHKCPSTDKWIKKMWSIYTIEYYSVIKKKEIMPLAATWMELEITILNEASQTEKDKYMISHIRNLKKMIQTHLFTKQKQSHKHIEQIWFEVTRGNRGR